MKRLIFTFILLATINLSKANTSTIFPNPANSIFTVKVDSSKKLKTIDLYNYLGVKIESVEYTFGNQLTANVSALKTGKYLVSLVYWDGSREVLSLVKK